MPPAAPTKPAPDRLRHKTVSAAVADALRQRILNGEFAPGVALRQDALAEEFGISRIPIREALLQLEAAGLVNIAAPSSPASRWRRSRTSSSSACSWSRRS